MIVDSSTLQYVYPDSFDLDISLESGSTIILGCPGSTLNYGRNTASIVEATCISGSTFLVNGETVTLSKFYCNNIPTSTARRTGKTCSNSGVEIEIGFALNSTVFARVITVCFDDLLKSPLYSFYHLTSKIDYAQTGVSRPNFKEGDFYNLDGTVDKLYSRAVQKKTINSQVGLPVSSTQYVKDNNNYYLSRGHLTAKGDFVYAHQQKATFWYVNTAPQWQTCNGANWNSIEDSVRRYASNKGLDLDIYTGVYGISNLPNESTDEPVDLYFYLDTNNNVALPIPEVYWKLVYNPQTTEHVVLIGVNNPYESNPEAICEDVSKSLTWLTWSKNDQMKGISYACSAVGLNAIISSIPDLDYGDLLL